MNTSHEFEPRVTHIIFGDEKIISKLLAADPQYYHRHPRRRYGKTDRDAAKKHR